MGVTMVTGSEDLSSVASVGSVGCGDLGADTTAAIRAVLDRVGDKWSLIVIGTLRDRVLRFTELRRLIPAISQRMLTLTLRQLERDGLISRTVHAEVPPRVEYRLTRRGGTLVAVAISLAEWSVENFPGIEDSRREYDARVTVT